MICTNRITRNVRWIALLLALSLLTTVVLLGPLAGTALAGQERVAVCHLDDEGDYIPITIADPALPTHQAHGDLIVGVDVDENCEPLDSDGDGVPDSADACDNPGALAMLDAEGITYTITSDGCVVLSGTLPYRANLSGIDLSGAILTGVNLNGLDITGADLSGADLSDTTGASTGGSSPIRADGANLSGANLTNTYLYGSSLVNANLSGAIINHAYLVNVNFTGADLSGATFDNTYCPDGTFSRSGGTCINNL